MSGPNARLVAFRINGLSSIPGERTTGVQQIPRAPKIIQKIRGLPHRRKSGSKNWIPSVWLRRLGPGDNFAKTSIRVEV